MLITKLQMPTDSGQATGACTVDGERMYFTCDGIARGVYRAYRVTQDEWDALMGNPLPKTAADWKRVLALVRDIGDRTPDYSCRHEDVDWSVVGDPVIYEGPEGSFRREGDEYVPVVRPTVESMRRERDEARRLAEEWRDCGRREWLHRQILKRGGHHLPARGYVLPEHGRRVFMQGEALAELGIAEPTLPWEEKR